MIKGENIGGPFYSKSAEDCQNICVENKECEYWNFEFVYFGKGNSWSLTGYGKCGIGRNSTGEGREEYFLAGLKGSCKDGEEKNEADNDSLIIVMLVFLLLQTLVLVFIAITMTAFICGR